MRIAFCGIAILTLALGVAWGQEAPNPPNPPCSTCVSGGGTPGTVPLYQPGSTATRGVIGDSLITQDSAGNVFLGPIVGEDATGSISGKLATFVGDLGGVIGWDKHLDENLSLTGVAGLVENTNGSGVTGIARATSGDASGVRGRAASPDGIGVVGVAGPPPGEDGQPAFGSAVGVQGLSRVNGGVGVLGINNARSGVVEGISGLVFSPNGTGGVFRNRGGGALIVAQSGPDDADKFRVDGAGNVYAAGSINAFSGLADVAERIDVTEPLRPGDVVEIDPAVPGHFRKVRTPRSMMVAGIVSSAPAVTLANSGEMSNGKPQDTRPVLALVGRVPVKVTSEGGPIRVGDLLTSSSAPGYAMRCAERLACVGAIVGKALKPLSTDQGVVEALVTLQ